MLHRQLPRACWRAGVPTAWGSALVTSAATPCGACPQGWRRQQSRAACLQHPEGGPTSRAGHAYVQFANHLGTHRRWALRSRLCARGGSLAGGQHAFPVPDSSAHSCRLTWRAKEGSLPSACSALTARTAEAQSWSAGRLPQLPSNQMSSASAPGMLPGLPVCTLLPLPSLWAARPHTVYLIMQV